MIKSRKIQRSFIVIFITLFFVVLGILFVFLSNSLRDKQTDILTLKREVAVNKINDEFDEIESILMTLSYGIKEGISDDVILSMMSEIVDNNDLVLQFYYGRPDQSYVLTADFEVPEGFNITERPWYQKALSEGDMAYTDVYIDAVEDYPIISIVLPIYNNSQTLGVLGVDIAVGPMTLFINNVIDENVGFAFVLDIEGHIIAHSAIDDSETLASYQSYDIPFDDLKGSDGITDTIKIFGERGKIAYEYVENSDFVFGIFMTNREINQNVFTLTIVGISLILIILVVIVVVINVYSHMIEKPLNALISDIEQINISTHPEYRLESDQKSGFREARLVINRLIDVSASYQTQLKKSLDKLAYENQKFKFLLDSSPDLVFVIDTNLIYQEVYGDTVRVLGIPENKIIGKTHRQIFGNRFYREREKQYRRALKGETVLYSWTSHYEKQTYYFETVISPIFNKDKTIIGVVGVSRDITEQENRYKEMLYVSTHDYLTDLYNRKIYDEKLNQMKKDKDFPFALINMDLNGLKLINDAYGHHDGDLAIKKTAELLMKSAKKSYMVSRVGGDEFTVIIPQASKRDVTAFIHKLKANFKDEKIHFMDLSIAVGYCISNDDSMTIDEIKKLAENDMYKEKILEKERYKNHAVSAINESLKHKIDYHKKHIERVIEYAKRFGNILQFNKEEQLVIEKAAEFYDIGKIALPDEILFKKGTLTQEEFDIVKTHTNVGYNLLKSAQNYSDIAIYAKTHHERYDGTGYPDGLEAEEIPYISRVLSVIESFVAMTSERPYRKKKSIEEAKKELIELKHKQFDPKIVSLFIEKIIDERG